MDGIIVKQNHSNPKYSKQVHLDAHQQCIWNTEIHKFDQPPWQCNGNNAVLFQTLARRQLRQIKPRGEEETATKTANPSYLRQWNGKTEKKLLLRDQMERAQRIKAAAHGSKSKHRRLKGPGWQGVGVGGSSLGRGAHESGLCIYLAAPWLRMPANECATHSLWLSLMAQMILKWRYHLRLPTPESPSLFCFYLRLQRRKRIPARAVPLWRAERTHNKGICCTRQSSCAI